MALTRPAPGEWTYDDLLALPDDGRRWEIIEGVLHEMSGPSWAHGAIVVNLLLAWAHVVRSVGGVIATAPVGVFFAGANPVQPDLHVALPGNPGHVSRRGFEGVPDLVVEILSPSTRGHDLLTKRSLYARAGVREYWLVDPDTRAIDVLAFDGENYRTAQRTTANDVAHSLLLPELSIPLAEVFAQLEQGPQPS